ncbi:hypothetical protein PINS_up024264 [Pythium insidiosum]|nr:hypothetical protein PINS_up024264 [Pythium insidiosum]
MKPEEIIFNVEIFHALFTSYCMQGSNSIHATIFLMVSDVAHSIAAMYDIHLVLSRIQDLQTKLYGRISDRSYATANSPYWLTSTALDHVIFLAEHDVPTVTKDPRIRVASRRLMDESTSTSQIVPIPTTGSTNKLRESKDHLQPDKSFDLVTANTHEDPREALLKALTPEERLEYTRIVLGVLHTVEFVVLAEFTEVIIPVIYCVFIAAASRNANAEFYPQVRGLTNEDFVQQVGRILVYASLELISFVVLCLLLHRKLRFTVIKQLAFVLDSEWLLIQLRLFVWVLFIVQNTLQHFGVDLLIQVVVLASASI